VIHSIRIRDFQKHRKKTIKFDSDVTTIVGSSGTGKTAILRALKWVLTNHPRGDAFIHHDASKASVSLRIDDHRISRRRGKGNTYHLDGSKFQAFGNNTPDEIARIINVSDLNFQGQHDASGFWFSMSPGEVSRQLNSIVDLSIMDSTLANLASMLRATSAEEKVIQSRLDAGQQARDALKETKRMDEELKVVERLEQRHEWAAVCAGRLSDLIEQALSVQAIKDRAAQRLSRGQKLIKTLEKLGLSLSKVKGHREQLSSVVHQIQAERTRKKTARQQARELEEELHQLIGDTCPLCGKQIQ